MTDYYVSTNGANSNSGSLDNPFADLRVFESDIELSAGDTIHIRGGEYGYSSSVDLSELTGTDISPITFQAYKNESPVLDFSGSGGHGLVLNFSQYVTLRGLEIRHADKHNIKAFGNESGNDGPQNVVGLQIESCEIHGHGRGGSHGNGVTVAYGADGTVVRSCELYDGKSGGNSDGFHAALDARNTVVENTICHHNSDDGVDTFGGHAHDPDNPATFRRVICHNNGTDLSGNSTGDGWGFKFGDQDRRAGGHTFERCVAFNNLKAGFGTFSVDVPVTLAHCSAIDTQQGKNIILTGTTHEIDNTLAHGGEDWDVRLGPDVSAEGVNWDQSKSGNFNTEGPISFRSRDPNNTDNFLRLPSDSPHIDAGVDVGMNYNGSAPDLGAYEYDGDDSATLLVYDGANWRQGTLKYYNGSEYVTP